MPLIIFAYNDPEWLDLTPDIIGFDSIPITTVIIQEEITEIIGFRDNPLPQLPSDLQDDFTWCLGGNEWDLSKEWNQNQ